MGLQAPDIDITAEPRALKRALGEYRTPSLARSVVELVVTVIPFASLWLLMWGTLSAGYWLGLLLAVPAAGLLVRLFMIQHDCSHGSFFPSRGANDWVGRAIGVLTLTPYDLWRHSHALHHASSGNLDRPRLGGIAMLTVREFRDLPRRKQLQYRLYRHPLVLFGLGPTYLFLLEHRLPVGFMRAGWMPWLSTVGTNAAIVLLVVTMIWLVGVIPFLLVQLPITLLASSFGVWLFYVQHQFEDTLWEHDTDWTFHEAALHGSSHYDLPAPLRWFTANIGIHHVHHLCSRIPFYRLPEVLRDHPELRNIGRLTLRQSLESVRLGLWDEEQRRLVSFAEAHTETAANDRAR
ncbi:fatty acid desaturase [Halomonas sp. MA07-2]|uniref:fatty acid desaturase n=1 Tax=Halomonas sp. MA07-2 TaxID=3440841 RepID=UPI003EEA14B9